jgi:homoserine/homoserine lactone efflux protein
MTLQFYITYFCVVFLATVIPGPNMLLAINHGINYGTRKAVPSAVGNTLGNLLIALISLAGLRAVLVASETLFGVIKWSGIVYLLYIGIRTFGEAVPSEAQVAGTMPVKITKTPFAIFMEGFLIAVGNPKGILFFTALFPQFINLSTASFNEFTVIFVTLAAIAFVGFIMYAALASRLRSMFHIPWFRRTYNRVTGGAFIGCGLAMALEKAKE